MTTTRRAPYVTRVARYFGDLGWRERRAVLEDLDRHLRDADVDPADVAAWTNRFGEPAEYARQVRVDAGLSVDERGFSAAQHRHIRSVRPRVRLAVVVALLLVVGMIGAFVADAHYQPLRFGDVESIGNAKVLTAGDQTEYRYTFASGHSFAIGTWIHNTGRVSVHVSGVELQDVLIAWDNWRVELGRDNDPGGDPPVTTSMRAFDLAPGHSRLLWFRGDFRACPTHYGRGSGVGFSTVDVDYRAAGIRHHKTLPLRFTYSVTVGPPCP